jgi:hypothetical protein
MGHLRTAVRRTVSALAGVPIPSWYDTHARHASAPPLGDLALARLG